jgi:hypothetical protein
LPGQGLFIGCDGTNYTSNAGAKWRGFRNVTGNYTISLQDQDYLLCVSASSNVAITSSGLPTNFSFGVWHMNQADIDVSISINGGTASYLSPGHSAEYVVGTVAGLNPTELGTPYVPAKAAKTGSSYAVRRQDNATVLPFDDSIDATWTVGANANTAEKGFWFGVQNSAISGGSVTIAPDSSKTINGLPNLTVFAGEGVIVFCDGTNYIAITGRHQFPSHTPKIANYAIVADDMGEMVPFDTSSASATLVLTFGANNGVYFPGFWFAVSNLQGGVRSVELLPDHGNIDGQAFIDLRPCEAVIVVCDGTNWYALCGRSCVLDIQEYQFNNDVVDMPQKPNVFLDLKPLGAFNFEGMVKPVDNGLAKIVHNKQNFLTTIKNLNVGTTAGDQIATRDGQDQPFTQDAIAIAWYDTVAAAWKWIMPLLGYGDNTKGSMYRYDDQNSAKSGPARLEYQYDTPGSSQNNYALDSAYLYWLPSASINLTGAVVQSALSNILFFYNASSTNTVTVKHQSTSSSAANRFICPGAVDLAIGPTGWLIAFYDLGLSRWVVQQSSGSSVSGTGTTNHVTYWTGTTTIGSISSLTTDGTNITSDILFTATAAASFHVTPTTGSGNGSAVIVQGGLPASGAHTAGSAQLIGGAGNGPSSVAGTAVVRGGIGGTNTPTGGNGAQASLLGGQGGPSLSTGGNGALALVQGGDAGEELSGFTLNGVAGNAAIRGGNSDVAANVGSVYLGDSNTRYVYHSTSTVLVETAYDISSGLNNIVITGETEVELTDSTVIGPSNLTGFAGGVTGRWVRVLNKTGSTQTFKHHNAGSTAGNQLNISSGSDLAVLDGGFVDMQYSSAYWYLNAAGGTGTVTSVDVSGGSTGFTFSGGPITTSGTITMSGTLAVGGGGTGTGSTPGSGQILIGNGSTYALQTITSTGATITLSAGGVLAISAITIAAGGTNADGSAYQSDGIFYYDGTRYVTTGTPSAYQAFMASGAAVPTAVFLTPQFLTANVTPSPVDNQDVLAADSSNASTGTNFDHIADVATAAYHQLCGALCP